MQADLIDVNNKDHERIIYPPDHLPLLILIAIYTGLRRGNIENLKWNQIAYPNGEPLNGQAERLGWITVPRSEMKVADPRRGDFRIPIHPILMKALKAQASKAKKLPSDFFVLTNSDKPVGDFRRSFGNAIRRAGIEFRDTRGRDIPFKFHDLRKTFATLLATRVVNRIILDTLTDHSFVNEEQIYVARSIDNLDAEKEKSIAALPDITKPAESNKKP